MHKFIILIILLLITGCGSITGNIISLVSNNQNVDLGDEIQVNINAQGTPQVSGVQVSITYDNSLTLNRVEEGSFFSESGEVITMFSEGNNSGNTLRNIIVLRLDGTNTSGSGTIASLYFNATTVGTADVNISSITLVDSDGEVVSDTTLNTEVTIIASCAMACADYASQIACAADACSIGNCVWGGSSCFAFVDSTPPSMPTGLESTVGITRINLTWSASNDNVGVAYYLVYRGGVIVGNTTSTNFTYTGLIANRNYSLSVIAYDTAGNPSIRSAIHRIATLATSDIIAPQIKAIHTVATNTSATIRWQTNEISDGEVQYGLGESYGSRVNNNTFNTIHQVHIDSLSPDTRYYYQVSSTDRGGNVGESIRLFFRTLNSAGEDGDDDNDGIKNSIDICPNTPAGAPVNRHGCPRPDTQKFSPSLSTNLSDIDLRNFTGFKLGIIGRGQIEFGGQNFKLLDSEEGNPLEFTNYVNFNPRSIEIKTASVPRFNKSATITFFALDGISEPLLKRDNQVCSECSIVEFTGTELTVQVPHFTTYSVEQNSSCGDNICDGSETCSTCSADCSSCSLPSPSNSGGGGGGGGGGGAMPSSNLTYNRNITLEGVVSEIRLRLKQQVYTPEVIINEIAHGQMDQSRINYYSFSIEPDFNKSYLKSYGLTLKVERKWIEDNNIDEMRLYSIDGTEEVLGEYNDQEYSYYTTTMNSFGEFFLVGFKSAITEQQPLTIPNPTNNEPLNQAEDIVPQNEERDVPIGLILGGLGVIAAIFIIFGVVAKKKSEPEDEYTIKLREYVKRVREAGASDEAIAQRLRESKWDEEHIKKVLK